MAASFESLGGARRGERRALSALAGIAAFVVCLIGLWATAVWTERSVADGYRAEAGRLLASYVRHVATVVDNFAAVPELVASDTRVVAALGASDQVEAANRYLEGVATATGALAVYAMDADGLTRAASNWRQPHSFVGKNYAFRPYFTTALAGQRGRFVAIGVTSKVPGYYVSFPVRDENRIIGAVVAKFDLSRLSPGWDNRQADAMLADAEGVVFLAGNDDHVFHSLAPLDAQARARLAETKSYAGRTVRPLPHVRRETADGTAMLTLAGEAGAATRRFVSVQTPVPGMDWTAVVLVDASGILPAMVRNGFLALLAGAVAVLAVMHLVQRRRYLHRLYETAIRDPLTGLYTRLYMHEAAERLLEEHNRKAVENVACVVFDIDHFKAVNDTFGHSIGDAVLKEVGLVVLDQARNTDIAVRFGGEELAVFLPVADLGRAAAFAERIRSAVEALPFAPAGKELRVTVSGGIALHAEGETLSELIARADKCLYDAKEAGRNRIEPTIPFVCDPAA